MYFNGKCKNLCTTCLAKFTVELESQLQNEKIKAQLWLLACFVDIIETDAFKPCA